MKEYMEPSVLLISLQNEDVLTTSGIDSDPSGRDSFADAWGFLK